MKKIQILLFILILLILPTLSAQPPFETQISSNGLEIDYPKTVYLIVNQSYSFHFHIFNVSNDMPMDNSTISCVFHLYNDTGDHIYVDTHVDHEPFSEDGVINEWAIYVAGNNFSYLGQYSYIFQCNNTVGDAGGFVSIGFNTYTDAGPPEIETSLLYLGLLFAMIILFIFSISQIWKAESYAWTVGILCFAYVILINIFLICWLLSINYLTINYIDTIFFILFLLTLISFFPFLLVMFFNIFLGMLEEKELKKWMEMGYSESEAKNKLRMRYKNK